MLMKPLPKECPHCPVMHVYFNCMSSSYRQRAEAAAQAEAAEAALVTLAESSGDEGDGGGTRAAATGGRGVRSTG